MPPTSADRFTGFDGDTPREPGQDLVEFPRLLEKLAKLGSTAKYRRPRCVGEIRTKTLEPLQEDLRNFARGVAAGRPADAFLNAASPGVIALFQPNDFYKTPDEYLEAVAEALRVEYEAIVAAGFLVQIDAPDLGMGRHTMYRHASVGEYLARAERHVEVLNHALRNIPGTRVRMHCCWGNYEGPHHHDVPMRDLLPVLLKAKPQALLFEAANPRHAHEWTVFRDANLPEDKILIPGVLELDDQLRGASRAGGRTAAALRRHRGTRPGHGRIGLRLQHLCRLRGGGSRHRLHETRRHGGGRADR